jgi:hypothetical protein
MISTASVDVLREEKKSYIPLINRKPDPQTRDCSLYQGADKSLARPIF